MLGNFIFELPFLFLGWWIIYYLCKDLYSDMGESYWEIPHD